MASTEKKQTVHSKIYWLIMTIAVILGLPGTIGIYLWISDHTTHSVRIPVYLLALPVILLVAAGNVIDDFLVGHCPGLVPESKRWMLAAGAQGQPAGPDRAQAVPAQAPAAAGAPQVAYGYPGPGATQQGAYQQPGAYPPGDGAPAPYGHPAHQPGSYQPGTSTTSSGYGTVPPATDYGYGAPS